MDPPVYTAPSAPPGRSILDLRSQIIANASVLKPRNNDERSRADHIEVVVARLPTNTAVPDWSSSNEKATISAQSQGESSARSGGQSHYALLTKRTTSKMQVQIILRGKVKGTVEEALEDILEQTEVLLHSHVVQYGTKARDGCAVM